MEQVGGETDACTPAHRPLDALDRDQADEAASADQVHGQCETRYPVQPEHFRLHQVGHQAHRQIAAVAPCSLNHISEAASQAKIASPIVNRAMLVDSGSVWSG